MNNLMQSLLYKVFELCFPGESFALQWSDSKHSRFNNFYNDFICRNPDDITWNELCEYAFKTKHCRNVLLLVLVLLDSDYGLHDHINALKRLQPKLIDISKQRTYFWKTLFVSDRIDDLFIYDVTSKNIKNADDAKHVTLYLPYANKYIQHEVYKSFKKIGRSPQNFSVKFTLFFEDSLSTMASTINSYKDFSDITFWKQANYFKDCLELSIKERNMCLRLLVQFYRYLVNEHTDFSYFGNSLHMSEALLFSPQLVHQIEQGYYVIPFNSQAKCYNKDRVIFLLRGYSSLSTKIKDDDFFTLDLSSIKSDFYRNELLKYYVSMPSVSVVAWAGQINYMRDALVMLERMKSQKNYPNPQLNYINNQEAVILKSYFSNENLKLATRNNKLGAIRRFLLWERNENKQIRFDDMFFEYLTQYEEPSKTQGKSIPDEHLGMISEWLAKQASQHHEMDLTYAALHLAIETEFRINQICHLKIDCLKPSTKPNEYIIQTYHKTGHGRLDSFVISELTYRHLMRIIENTEPYREKCTRRELSNYIFLYDGNMNSIALMEGHKFRQWFQEACTTLSLPKYNCRNIRDTHMTKSFEYVLRHGKSDLVMSALSKHKYIDTTKNHYIEQKLNDMLEATYGIIIGNLDDCYNPSTHIADKIPKEIDKSSNVVENGCGNCKSEFCTMKNALPCLICNDFITTVEHEPAFRRAIEAVDQLIQKSNTRHDKDDLTTIKLLLVMYLKAIYQKKQEEINT